MPRDSSSGRIRGKASARSQKPDTSAPPATPAAPDILREQSAGLLAAIVDSSDDAIVSKDLDGVITSWNKGAERLFGYTAAEAVGRKITLIIPEDRLDEETSILERLRRGDRVDHFETIRVRNDGTPLNVSLSISPVRDARGRVIGASKVARDITERKRSEAALEEALRRQSALFLLADRVQRSRSLDEVLEAALDAVMSAAQPDRASILLKDEEEDVLRVVACRGLSEKYRRATQRHFLWTPDDVDPEPLCIGDVDRSELDPSLRQALHDEGVRALCFVPLVSAGKLIGRFATHFNAPRSFSDADLALNVTIARQLAFAISRKRSEEALHQSRELYRALAETLESEVRIRTAELERSNSGTLRQAEELRDLSLRLLVAQDEERRRVARELHDSAGQTIAALMMRIDQLIAQLPQDAPVLAEAAQDCRALAQQLNQEIRTTSYLLHPPMLDEIGLAASLSWYVDGVAQRSGIDARLELPKNLERLPREMELVVFRLVQECLTNIHRHSGSKSAEVRLALENGGVSLEVSDHGKGMSPEKLAEIQSHGSGVGIRGMRERLRQFQGHMNIESNGSGTRFLFTIPVAQPAFESEQQSAAAKRLAV